MLIIAEPASMASMARRTYRMDRHVKYQFENFLDEHVDKLLINGVAANRKIYKDFLIQYSWFELYTCEDSEKIIFKCSIIGDDNETTGSEAIIYLDIKLEAKNDLLISSKDGKIEPFVLTKDSLTHRGQSDSCKVFAIDMFPEFKPMKFSGRVITGGGKTEFNNFKIYLPKEMTPFKWKVPFLPSALSLDYESAFKSVGLCYEL